MYIDESVLKNEEKIAFSLRALYQKSGYVRYKMSKFEEYDFYAVNRDFLVSDNIITFTDTNGKLMALKPDVTLSIVRGTKDTPGKVSKLYYDENVYRVSRNSHGFKEIMQAGIECIGDLSDRDICEVVLLAAKSLKLISDESVLKVSHQGVVSGLLDEIGLYGEERRMALKFIGEKNLHELSDLLKAAGADNEYMKKIKAVFNLSGTAAKILPELKKIGCSPDETAELETLNEELGREGFGSSLIIDFSVVNDMNYYNGIVFRGFVNGIPAGVLSGGQYDKLLLKLGRRSRAVGFAVYTDLLERFEVKEPANA
ncbi:MAG: ATP phosphoribosyltransferase regulatory subunit [Eubacteriales bacterium]|nr:ATP phosphoribosyltransferase regulatory subunit [Eubacteriales bacterium]